MGWSIGYASQVSVWVTQWLRAPVIRVEGVQDSHVGGRMAGSLPESQTLKLCCCFFFLRELYYFYLFIFGCVGSSLLRGLSLVVESEGYSSLRCVGFSLRWLLLLRSTGSRRMGFSSCGSQALEHRLSSCGTWALECRLSSCGARA